MLTGEKVMAVEQDYMMKVSALTTQASAPWGLASISSRTAGAKDYIYDSSAGIGTFSYVVDTGVRLTHVDFEGRAIFGFNAVSGSTSQADNNGHGTHVAGTVGGKTYGVAKKTTIVAVKVFEGAEGSASDVFSGFDWAVNDIVSKGRQNTAVINMSLGGSASKTWDAAITAAWKKGVLAVVAAGNENTDASTSSPARSPEVICVGNVEQDNKRHGGGGGSNYGADLDRHIHGISPCCWFGFVYPWSRRCFDCGGCEGEGIGSWYEGCCHRSARLSQLVGLQRKQPAVNCWSTGKRHC
jgi:oryzin